MSEINDNYIVLNDENGDEIQFEFLDLIEHDSKEYVVLLPAEDDDGEVVILEIEETDGDEEGNVSVDDEETLMQVFEIFKEKFKQEFNFLDE